jgi:hypothetical protein
VDVTVSHVMSLRFLKSFDRLSWVTQIPIMSGLLQVPSFTTIFQDVSYIPLRLLVDLYEVIKPELNKYSNEIVCVCVCVSIYIYTHT